MLISAGSAPALADTGSDGAKGETKSSNAAGRTASGPRYSGHVTTGSIGTNSAADHQSSTPRPPGHRPLFQINIDGRAGTTTPTTRITKNRTRVIVPQLAVADATADDEATSNDAPTNTVTSSVATVDTTVSNTAADVIDTGTSTAMKFQAMTVDATTADDVTALDTPAQSSESAPTTDEASTPTTQDPAPTEEPAPVVDSETLVPPTSDLPLPSLPAEPTIDASASGSDPTSTEPTASVPDTTGGSTGSEVVQEVTTGSTDPVTTVQVTTASLLTLPFSIIDVITAGFFTGATSTEAGATGALANQRRSTVRDAVSPLQILRMLTLNPGPSIAAESNGIPSLLTGSNHTRADSAASASGTNAAMAGASSPSAVTPVDPGTGLQSFLHTYGKLIVAVSLSAVLAAALPGLLGLLIPALAGTRIGYRQAKAGRALSASKLAHLAPSAPIGVVRSGKLIALRPAKRCPPARELAVARHEVVHQDVA